MSSYDRYYQQQQQQYGATQYGYSQYYQPQYQTPWYGHNYPHQQQAPQGQYYAPYPGYPYQQQYPRPPPGYPGHAPMPQPGTPPSGPVNPYYYYIDQQLRPLRQPIGTHILHGVSRLASGNWGLVQGHFQQIRPLAVAKTNQIIQEIKTMVLAGQGAQLAGQSGQQWLMAKIATASQDIYTQIAALVDPNVSAGTGGTGGQVQGQ